jgi:mannose-6-phosphate isomerase-like protein (cupin superfamily)
MTRRAIPKTELLGVEFDGRRVGHVVVDTDGDRDEWEMHPTDDEFLYLVEGAIDVILRADPDREEERRIELRAGSACVVPQGAWHRQVVVAPCKMLFVSPETLHRPYVWVPETCSGVRRASSTLMSARGWGSGRVEADVGVMGWPLSESFRLLGGTG